MVSSIVVVVSVALGQSLLPAPIETEGAPAGPLVAPLTPIEELSLEDLLALPVSVATRVKKSALYSPASVWVITAEQIALAGYRSVGEALGSVPGLYVSYDLVSYHVAVRGSFGGARAGSRQLRIMVNGQPVDFATSGTYLLGPEFLPIDIVERIEVMKGPASSLYGAGALVGAVNVVTKLPPPPAEEEAERASAAASVLGGSATARPNWTTDLGASVGLATRKFQGLLAGALAVQDRSGLSIPTDSPFRDRFLDASGQPLTTHADLARTGSLFAQLNYRLGGGQLAVSYLAQLDNRAAEFHDLTAFSHDTRVGLFNGIGTITYERPLGWGLSIFASARVGTGRPLASDRIDLGRTVPFYTLRDFRYDALTETLELRFLTEDERLSALVGGERSDDFEQPPQYVDVDRQSGVMTPRPRPPLAALANTAAYGQVSYQLFEWASLTGTLRYDGSNIFGPAVTGRLGAVLNTEKLVFKLLGGTSFKAPSPEQLYGIAVGPLDVRGDPTLRPQYMRSLEVDVDYTPFKSLSLSLTGFLARYDPLIAYVARSGQLQPSTLSADSFGGELVARANHTFGPATVDAFAALSVQNFHTSESVLGGIAEKMLPDNEGVPQVMGTVGVDVKLKPYWVNVHLEYHGVSDRAPSQSNLMANGTTDMSAPSYRLKGYHLVDAAVSSIPVAVGPVRLSAMVKASNLLDQRYTEVGFNGIDVPTIGRTVWLQLRVQL